MEMHFFVTLNVVPYFVYRLPLNEVKPLQPTIFYEPDWYLMQFLVLNDPDSHLSWPNYDSVHTFYSAFVFYAILS